ncbi:helix-turn-helix transcriptional regulator [Micromonospora marina]|uniref:helix-turn-helix transcriptional regulator n=1 Tax=Micromonospora marina TaxID=307120 RepID=UPI00345359CB
MVPGDDMTVGPVARENLLGRQAELFAIEEELLSPSASRRRAVLLRGDPGVGKTLLTDAVAARTAAAGWRLLRGAGVESEAELAYAGLHQALHPLLPDAERLPPGQREVLHRVFGLAAGSPPDRLAVSAAAVALLTLPGRRHTLLIFDDLHWVDPSSAQVLGFVARRLAGTQVSFLGAVRIGWSSSFDGAGCRELVVRPLDRHAAATLLDQRHPWLAAPARRRVLAEAAGNPLALVELPNQLDARQRSGHADLPETLPLSQRLEELYATRTRGLPPSSRRILELAALESTGELHVIARAAKLDPARAEAALADAVSAGLVRLEAASGQVRFRHPLVRSSIVRMTSSERRAVVHAALAEALTNDPERRAWHMAGASAGPDPVVATELEDAARRALARGGTGEAAALLARAADLTADQTARGPRLAEAAFLYSKAGRLDDAHRLLRDAPRDGEMVEEVAMHATAAAYLSVYQAGDFATAYQLLTEVVPRIPRTPAHAALLDDALYMLLIVCYWQGRPELWAPFVEALDAASDHARLLYEAVGDPARTGHLARARFGAVVRDLPPGERPWGINWLSFAAIYVDATGEYEDLWRRTVALRDASGTIDAQMIVIIAASHDAFLRGRLDEAQALAGEGLELAETHDYQLYVALFRYLMACPAAVRGDAATVAAMHEQIRAWEEPRDIALLRAMTGETATLAALAAGDVETAFQRASEVSPPGVLRPYTPHAMWMVLDLVEAAVRTDRPEAARAHARAAAEAGIARISSRVALLVAGAIAYAADEETMEVSFEAALAVPAARRWTFEYARVQLGYGERLRRRRNAVAARRHLSAALATFERIGAEPWRERAKQELRAAGVAVRQDPVPADSPLTAQEWQIAELAAAGLSNKEIGTRLRVSPRTVSSHLYRIFPKLNVTTRAALGAALRARRGADGPPG